MQPYLVLEHVEGGNLKGKLAGRTLPPREAARLVLVLARAMEAAHAQGIVHRDLKPANILLQKDEGRSMKGEKSTYFLSDSSLILHPSSFLPKITDFGLAKELGRADMTPTGVTVGTPGYMAPELANRGTVGPAADIYALGAILYELLIGRPPFVGDTPVVVVLRVLHEAPGPTSPKLQPGVPRDLEVICLRNAWRRSPAGAMRGCRPGGRTRKLAGESSHQGPTGGTHGTHRQAGEA